MTRKPPPKSPGRPPLAEGKRRVVVRYRLAPDVVDDMTKLRAPLETETAFVEKAIRQEIARRRKAG